MADDDDGRGPAPDPWDEIVADGLGDAFSDDPLLFEETEAEASTPGAAPSREDGAVDSGPDPAAAEAEAGHGDTEDASIEDWLSGDEGAVDAGSPVLSVFAPDEATAGLSGIDGGTGLPDVAEREPAGPDDGGFALADAGNADADEWPGGEPVSVPAEAAAEGVDEALDMGAAAATAAGAVVAVPTSATARPAPKSARKSGGIGRAAGIALGGLLAIPAAGALLFYGLGQDPFGIAKVVSGTTASPPPATVPTIPPEASTVAEEPVPSLAEDPPTEPAPVEPASAEPLPDATMQAAAEPPSETLADVVAVDEASAVEPAPQPRPEPDAEPDAVPEPAVMPEPAPPLDAVAMDVPGLEALAAQAPGFPPPPPAPPALDTAALDEAVGEAAALGEALAAVDDRGNRAHTLLRTRWYRSLARVAEELVALEHAAVASGRHLDMPPENVVLLHGTIGGREALAAELAALAPDWLSYAKRGSDGVVLPVTVESARKVGPFWAARASLAAAGGEARPVTLISRSEPVGVAGGTMVVTGVVLEGGVIWAVDVRAADDAAPGL